ncbi:hypothetical protein HanIR_Chr04g0202741 [Helianthus annuus]|nr:hypothetical protein HanIR_Chr04g0202741 [Helianthus annuus]
MFLSLSFVSTVFVLLYLLQSISIPVFLTWYQSLHAPVDDRLYVFRCIVECRLSDCLALLLFPGFLFLELVVDSRSVYFRLKRIETLSQGFKCCLSVLGNFWLILLFLKITYLILFGVACNRY